MREGIRILRTNILPRCFASSISVHRSAICCHKHRLCETRRKKNYRMRSEQPPTNRSSLPICGFTFAKETNLHRGEHEHLKSVCYRNEVESHYGALCSESDPIFLQYRESSLTAKSCLEYLQLEEVLNLPWPV